MTSYINMINDDAKVKVYVTAKVLETGQFFAKHEIYNIEKPDLDIKVTLSKHNNPHNRTTTNVRPVLKCRHRCRRLDPQPDSRWT